MSYCHPTNGRLCNNIIKYVCGSIIAEKHNLQISYDLINDWYNKIYLLGIQLFNGIRIYDKNVLITENNFIEYLNLDILESNIVINGDYFQTKDASNYAYKHLNEEKQKNSIMEKNKYKDRYNTNNDCFIHIRLGDMDHNNPGFVYYDTVLSMLSFNTLYISSDNPEHQIIKDIQTKYPNTIINNYDEIDTIHFGSTCKHVILSHGSFSAVIGYLSFFSNVYYPFFDKITSWHGDIFSIPNWTKISY
jgi:hypothetical protein